MKDWKYYNKPSVEYYGFEYRKQYRDKLIEAIHNTPMTKADRDTALRKVNTEVRNHMLELNRPYNAAILELTQEFWADARYELGYDDFLDADGISALESLAYQKGYGSGFSSVFSELQDLSYFAEKIAKSAVRKAIDNSAT